MAKSEEKQVVYLRITDVDEYVVKAFDPWWGIPTGGARTEVCEIFTFLLLTRSVARFLSFQLIFTVNSAHKNYKLYLPYSKTTLHLQNNFFLHMVITMSHHSGYEARKIESKFRKT